MSRFTTLAVFGALIASVPGFAQAPVQQDRAREQAQDGAQQPNWRELLNNLHRLDLASDRCDQVQPSGREMIRLEDAIAYVEKKLDLSPDALDEFYAKIEYEIGADKRNFCGSMANAVDAIRNIPAEYKN